MKGKPRLFIIDPNLKDAQGHYLSYAARVAGAAADLGIGATVIANRSAAKCGALDLRPVLEQDYWEEMISSAGTEQHAHIASSIRRFSRTIREVLIDCGACADDVLFLPYANVVETQAVASINHLMDDSLPRVVFLFRRELEEQGENTRLGRRSIVTLLRQAVADLFCGAAASRIRLFTDSDELTGEYEEALGFRVQTAPIPVRARLRVEQTGSSPVTLLYLGDARTEKGYTHLPRLAHALSDRLRTGQVRLVVQSNFNVPEGEPGIPEAREALSQYPGVELLCEPLAEEKYLERLSEASLVLLPYQPSNYVARTSGILAEAIVAGVPAIVPGGTWMSQQVRRFGAGLCFDGSAEGLVRTVELALDRVPALRQQAEDRRPAFAGFHNPSRLARFVCGVEVLEKAGRCLAFEKDLRDAGIEASRDSASGDGLGADMVATCLPGPRMILLYKDRIVQENYPDAVQADLFSRCIRSDKCVLDLGAHHGLYSLLAARRVGPGGRVYSFEPEADNFRMLQTNIWLNGLGGVIKPVRARVGSADGETEFELARGMSWSHALKVHPGLEVAGRVKVPAVSLDVFFSSGAALDRPVGIVKMDVEGNEVHALKGMRGLLLGSPRMVLFAELYPTLLAGLGSDAAEMADLLEEAGFAIYVIDEECRRLRPYAPLWVREKSRDPFWHTNIYAIRERWA
jgi:FkbM family methyltransferase